MAHTDYSFLDLDDLYGDLIRYGHFTEAEAREKFPVISEAMVLRVMCVSDECPECSTRFIMRDGQHAEGCRLAHLPAGAKPAAMISA